MNIEKWQLLLKSIDSGSLSAAASQTNYTTSGISRIIATLEEEVGFSLLVRNHRGVTPTKECEALLPDIRSLIHAEEQLSQQVAQLNGLEVGSLTIGTAYSSSYPILTKRVVKFVKRYPNIKVSILWGYNRELRHAVQERKIDVCIVSKGDSSLLWYPLQEDRMIALVSSQHPLARAQVFPVRLFATEPYIDIYHNSGTDSSILLQQFNIEPNTKFTTSDRYAAHEMVGAGLGVTLINETLLLPAQQNVCALPLDPPQTLEIGMACLAHPTLATKRFIEFMQEDA